MTDPQSMREVLGNYPTSVCAITTRAADGTLLGMAVGSFTSISLDPPLVGFFVDDSSTTWPAMAAIGRFCVNLLGADQAGVCRQFATRGADRFAGVDHDFTPSGMPRLTGALAWIDCSTLTGDRIGDHHLIVGRVEALGQQGKGRPLLFFRRGFHDLGKPVS